MPISPADAEKAAEVVRRIYADAERVMAARIARRVARGVDTPDDSWYAIKMAEVQHVRREVEAEVRKLRQSDGEVISLIEGAYKQGSDAAIVDLRGLDPRQTVRTSFTASNRAAVERLARVTVDNLQSTQLRILRSADDVYRRVVADTAAQVLTGTQTRREAAQAALNRFADQGISGFVDSAGRSWTMESYAEMATRTGAGQAAVQGHLDRFVENGRDLVIVSVSVEPCSLCDPWEGQVLSVSGVTAGYPTVDEARAAGLWHPNCTHTVGAYIPGLTEDVEDVKKQQNPEGYAMRQHQRYLERGVRKWKLRESVAITDDARREARSRVRAWQGRLREFVAEEDRFRLRYREQIRRAI